MSDRLDDLDKDFEYLARYIYGLSDQVYIPNDSKDTTGVKVTVDINDLVKSLQSYIDSKIIEARIDEWDFISESFDDSHFKMREYWLENMTDRINHLKEALNHRKENK